MGETVKLCEVGPRDGLQMAASIMPTDIKIEWIASLARAGLREIEVGSFVPPTLIPQMADTGEVVRASRAIDGLTVIALVPNLKGAQRAHENGADGVIVPVSVSEGHSRANTNKGSLEQVAEVRAIVEWVKGQELPMKVEAGCATAFGCSIEGQVPVGRVVMIAAALADAGVDGVVLADTVGYGNPAQVHATVRAVGAEIGAALDRLHLHDTMGLGLANALAGLEEGIRCFDSALAGLGGCPFAPGASGNIVTEDLVFMLESMGFSTGIDLDGLFRAREVLQRGLRDTALLGNVAKAGIPRTYSRAA
ncbi:hydroxymethylglutaryl-CoA lyase [Ancylobacter aquaticus]|uniref:Hydroxymethylglutaryl-CoA lyase n=1 Tax=Ancylobacter aquaticus TaxID=100 RepID=A0A4R1ICN0_ANCAQ|nr:hydroxymethylglutaryl-CoA lyase [Ancylobacter aquaticus]TCK28352.1 hydroxymethylglutaryl-CoA lyase [Ancylobacter aquaticus]